MSELPFTPALVVHAYRQGIFPMADDDGTIGWYQPDPRAVFPLDAFHVPKSLAKTMRRRPYQITQAGLARTFQNIRLFQHLSVLDNLKVACHLRTRQSLAGALLRPVECRAFRIGVDQGDAVSSRGPRASEVQRQRRLADATFLIEQRDDHRRPPDGSRGRWSVSE